MEYPNKIRKTKLNALPSYKNRGMILEKMLNDTNNYYLEYDIAVIHKKPTPIKVLETKYKSGIKQEITRAFYEEKSTTDYNGVYKGKYIDFEAKETKNKDFFPINNIHSHQIEHMEKVVKQKGICFLIISFTSLNEIYLLSASSLIELVKNNKKIELSYLRKNGYLIKEQLIPSLDYLKIVDSLEETL